MYPVDLLKVGFPSYVVTSSAHEATDQDANHQSVAWCNLLRPHQRVRDDYEDRGCTISLAWYDQRHRWCRYG